MGKFIFYRVIRRKVPVLRIADERLASVVPLDTAHTHCPDFKIAVSPSGHDGFSKRHAKQDPF